MRATIPVVGVSYRPGYPLNAGVLRRFLELCGRGKGPAVVLVREPDNPHDVNAVAVHVPALEAMIGHLPREDAAWLAPLLDAGARFDTYIERVRIRQDHPDRPGIDIAVYSEVTS